MECGLNHVHTPLAGLTSSLWLCFAAETVGRRHVVVAGRAVRQSRPRRQDARRLSAVSAGVPRTGRQVRARAADSDRDAGQPGPATHRAATRRQPAAGDQARRRDDQRRRRAAPVRRQRVSAAVAVLRLRRGH